MDDEEIEVVCEVIDLMARRYAYVLYRELDEVLDDERLRLIMDEFATNVVVYYNDFVSEEIE